MNKNILTFLSISFIPLCIYAKEYRLDVCPDMEKIRSSHLNMGANLGDGRSIELNNLYMARDGKPVIPVMGEFHFSRYPADRWEQEIRKMKSGGIHVIATYVFWNIHEENEGEWNWSGNRDLKRFVEICGDNGLDVLVRIGPFCHGEIRSGGLPDWLFTKNIDVRSNDPLYLSYAEKLYRQVASQLKGLYYKDGGPIIGCQIENEHQHSAAPWALHYDGEPTVDFTASSYDKGITKLGVSIQEAEIDKKELGNRHMSTLLRMAKDAGIDTPIYTATGWGNAAIVEGETLPVTAGYTYATWVPAQEMSKFCLFKDLRDEPDYSPVRYNAHDYPSASAEMGVGIQIGYGVRPICTAEAAEAMIVRTIGGGANILGYYMYHGGSTPTMQGNGGFFSDQGMGLPKISYDFQAPLGEFGIEHIQYRPLRVIHHFLAEFGDRLAPMQTVLPADAAMMTPDNRDDLRYAARVNENGEGFLFIVNSQDHDPERLVLKDVKVNLNTGETVVSIPEQGGFTVAKNTSMILPFNFNMDGVKLKYAVAQPLLKLEDNGIPHYFFTVRDEMKPEYVFYPENLKGKNRFDKIVPGFGSTFTVTSKNGQTIKVTTLLYEQALNAVKQDGKLIITSATVAPQKGKTANLYQLGNNDFEYIVYPSDKGFKTQRKSVEKIDRKLTIDRNISQRMNVWGDCDASLIPQVNDFFLKVDYTGDLAMAFVDNKFIHDHFWQGRPWTIGLHSYGRQMAEGKPLGFYFRPLRKNAPFLKDLIGVEIPDLSSGPVLEIEDPELVPEYVTTIDLD